VESQESFTIHTPLLFLSKAEIIKEGIQLGVDYSQTVSCYRADVDGRACGSCDSCVYRKKGFKEAGVDDQTRYVSYM
jgi:7-cyano-7-deazaguanine synthase